MKKAQSLVEYVLFTLLTVAIFFMLYKVFNSETIIDTGSFGVGTGNGEVHVPFTTDD